jgi:hypothetical protein
VSFFICVVILLFYLLARLRFKLPRLAFTLAGRAVQDA